MEDADDYKAEFYHSEKLQSTKTWVPSKVESIMFYHSEKLQSTKTMFAMGLPALVFYHSEKLQSTKTCQCLCIY